jgi:hypothetical protein
MFSYLGSGKFHSLGITKKGTQSQRKTISEHTAVARKEYDFHVAYCLHSHLR